MLTTFSRALEKSIKNLLVNSNAKVFFTTNHDLERYHWAISERHDEVDSFFLYTLTMQNTGGMLQFEKQPLGIWMQSPRPCYYYGKTSTHPCTVFDIFPLEDELLFADCAKISARECFKHAQKYPHTPRFVFSLLNI